MRASLAQRTCEVVTGEITNIFTDWGGGRRFEIGGRKIAYDNHAPGFEGVLCDDVALCDGDYGRLCLDGAGIARIEKWAAPRPTTVQRRAS